MDNTEITETKKKTKIGIFNIVMVGITVLLLGFFIYLKIAGGELFLFGYVWHYTDMGNFLNALLCVWIFIPWIGQPKNAKRRNAMILCAVLFVLEIVLISLAVYEDIKGTADKERITLSDGSEILLHERVTHSTFDERKYEYTYMDVYQINGITAKMLGGINETYFSNRCLLQDKYAYEYDEADKKLTVVCEYGTYGDSVVHLKEEYDTGFWKEEFLLE